MTSPNPLDTRAPLLWIVNLYTRNGSLPADQEQTLQHLAEAVAASRSAQPQVLVRVAPAADLEPDRPPLGGAQRLYHRPDPGPTSG